MERLRLVYVAGCTHSGTTLLNRLLNAHPDIVAAGGLKNLPAALAGRMRCSCGAPVRNGCPLWHAVHNALLKRGRALADLQPDAADPGTFRRDNLDLLLALREASGARIVIDTSRRAERLRRLAGIPELDVIPILLFKDPRSQAGSFRRKGMGLGTAVANYWRGNLRPLARMTRHPDGMVIQYEDVCADPAAHLLHICHRLDLEPRADTLRIWGGVQTHMLGGNRMHSGSSSCIRTDQSWRTQLDGVERAVAGITGYPILAACRARRLRIPPPSIAVDAGGE